VIGSSYLAPMSCRAWVVDCGTRRLADLRPGEAFPQLTMSQHDLMPGERRWLVDGKRAQSWESRMRPGELNLNEVPVLASHLES
jgi:hypothetical protein